MIMEHFEGEEEWELIDPQEASWPSDQQRPPLFSIKVSLTWRLDAAECKNHSRQHHATVQNKAQDQHTSFQAVQCKLLGLPPELRRRIYELVLDTGRTHTNLRRDRRCARHASKRSVLSLLGTCRQVLHEAEPIFYSVNRLKLIQQSHEMWSPRSIIRREAVTSLITQVASPSDAYAQIKHMQIFWKLANLRLERLEDIRYLNFSHWKIFKKQFLDALLQFGHLKEIDFINLKPSIEIMEQLPWYEASTLTQLRRLDDDIRQSVAQRTIDGT